jgi:hypothetical protein
MTLLWHYYSVARPKNSTTTHPISVSITQEIYEVLERLSRSGRSGKSPPDTAEELIRRGIESLAGSDFYREVILQPLAAQHRSSKQARRLQNARETDRSQQIESKTVGSA